MRFTTAERGGRARRAGLCALVALTYALSAWAGMLLAIPPGNVTAVFPASGVALAAVLTFGLDVLPGVWLGSFLGNAIFFGVGGKATDSALIAAMIALGACGQAAAGLWLLARTGAGNDPLSRAKLVPAFALFGGAASCVVSATWGVGVQTLLGLVSLEAFGRTWLTWWVGDCFGVLTVAPALLVWRGGLSPSMRGRAGEALLLLLVTLLVGLGAARGSLGVAFLTMPLMLWAAYRFAHQGVAVMAALLSAMGAIAAVRRAGPFSSLGLDEAVLLLQSYAGTVAVAGLMLAALVLEHQQAEARLRRANDELEEKVADRTRALDAMLRAQVQERAGSISAALSRMSTLGDAQPDLLPSGTTLGDQASIVRLIGVGGMAEVYEGRHLASGQPVAVKVIHARAAGRIEGLHRFLNEARAAALIDHAAVVRSLDVDVTDDGRLFQILELLEGETLARRLRRAGPLGPASAARLGATLAGAVAAAHRAGVVHRDIKPGNVMLVGQAPGVKLLDFGISKLVSLLPWGTSGNDTGPTGVMGTPAFMSPEQVRDPGSVDASTDIYSLGLLIYEAASGRSPFDVRSASQFVVAHLTCEPRPLSALLPGAPASLIALLDRMLAKDPAARPSAAEVEAELSRLADQLEAPPTSALAPPSSPPSLDASAPATITSMES